MTLINGLVDWARLGKALAFYRAAGFLECELPWHAPRDVCALTCPEPERMYGFEDGVLVGSAEQSFMAAQKEGMLPPMRYVSLTPCFRREREETETHKRYFMKVELFQSHKASDDIALEFAELAKRFMEAEGGQAVDIVRTAEGYDLEIAGIEVGSYSGRSLGGMEWTCGTGLAEPRFTTAVLNAEAGLTPLKSNA